MLNVSTVCLCVAATTTMSSTLAALDAPAMAAGDPPSGYLQYATTFGDTYNGVTTDDGDHLSGSYSAKARLFYGSFAASFAVYRDLSRSQINATAPGGGPGTALSYPGGQVIVPAFTASDSSSEIRLEYQAPRIPVYLGLAYSNSSNNYNFPRLLALGVGVELMPNPHHVVSPFGSFFYFPDQTGTYPLANPNNPASGSVHSAFIANELEVGAAVAFPKTDLSLVLGYYQNTNVRKTGTFNFVRDGPFVGLGYRVH